MGFLSGSNGSGSNGGSSNGKNGEAPAPIANIPKHIAIIMDGNGRWAKSRFLPRVEGHRAGVKSVRMVVEEARKLGVRYLTLFAFSTENWQRPGDEVSSLMKLFRQHLDTEFERLIDNGIRLRAIGEVRRLPDFVQESLHRNIEKSRHLDGMDLVLAVSYGGRDEIVQACRKLAAMVKDGSIDPQQIDSRMFSSALYAPDIPDPDLLIRTSDESRISNFLLWQLAYSEIIVTPVLWPEFDKEEFMRCIREYSGRNRRFGLTQEQVRGSAPEA